VYFRCQLCTWSENTSDNFSLRKHGLTIVGNNEDYMTSLLSMAMKMEDPFLSYRILLMHYAKRTFTNERDAIAAIKGLLRRLGVLLKHGFLEGLPVAIFDLAILFKAHESPLHRRPEFPSYSWAGWRGSLDVDDVQYVLSDLNDWLYRNTWIIWYKRSKSGITNLVWDVMAHEAFAHATKEDLGYRQRSPFGKRHQFKFSTSRTVPTETIHFERQPPGYPVLQFWTLAVHLRIVNIDVFEAEAVLLDNQQNKCGILYMDGFEQDTFFENGLRYEFILLSEGTEPNVSKALSNTCGLDMKSYYHVLVLEWKGGIAERRGYGKISLPAVDRSFEPGPEWKEILLS
jgi:hypothetical protein